MVPFIRFVRFTDPDGQDVHIAARFVTRVRDPLPGRYPANVHTVIVLGGESQAVKETVEEVLRKLEGERADD